MVKWKSNHAWFVMLPQACSYESPRWFLTKITFTPKGHWPRLCGTSNLVIVETNQSEKQHCTMPFLTTVTIEKSQPKVIFLNGFATLNTRILDFFRMVFSPWKRPMGMAQKKCLPQIWDGGVSRSGPCLYGGFLHWGFPKTDGLWSEILLKWMIWGYPHIDFLLSHRHSQAETRYAFVVWWLRILPTTMGICPCKNMYA